MVETLRELLATIGHIGLEGHERELLLQYYYTAITLIQITYISYLRLKNEKKIF